MNVAPRNLRLRASRWHGRDVLSRTGNWSDLRETLPDFEMRDFAVDGGATPNPHLRSIVRMPHRPDEDPIPLGVVSPTYSLVQHRKLGDLCVQILHELELYYDRMRCNLELTELGEWMHLSFHLDDYSLVPPDGHKLDLRLELFKSVDGSSRLILLLGWFRFVCSNGLIIGNTVSQLADAHDKHLDLKQLRDAIVSGLQAVANDRQQMSQWFNGRLTKEVLQKWADGPLAKKWGKKAAARCLLICESGQDGEYVDPFAGGRRSEREMRPTEVVPGAVFPAKSHYDVAQTLSWIATTRTNVEERLSWQTDVPGLVSDLRELAKT